MTTVSLEHAPKIGPAEVPKSWGKVNTASNRFEKPDYGDKNELKEKFTEFVGETFFSQMIKSMRSTVGKPAYFHGGRGEEAFQGLMDQQIAKDLTKSTGDKFAGPMFARQFPDQAAKESKVDYAAFRSDSPASLSQLQNLPRR
ncbi:MAG: rod-binding protein [Pirellulales bacterium]